MYSRNTLVKCKYDDETTTHKRELRERNKNLRKLKRAAMNFKYNFTAMKDQSYDR